MSGFPRVNVAAAVNHLVRGVDLYVFVPHVEDGTFSVVAGPVAFERVAVDASPPPLFSLGRDEAQRLMDDLWHAGLRPTQAAAGDAHIEDLRRLVFGSGQADDGAGAGLIGALTQAALAVVLPEITLSAVVLGEDGTNERDAG